MDDYSFGSIQVDGTEYTQDLKLFPHEIKPNWWRDEGHLLQVADIEDVLEYEPRLLMIGQGAHGRMKISDEVKTQLDHHGISFEGIPTAAAVERYNETEGDVIGVFHLTC